MAERGRVSRLPAGLLRASSSPCRNASPSQAAPAPGPARVLQLALRTAQADGSILSTCSSPCLITNHVFSCEHCLLTSSCFGGLCDYCLEGTRGSWSLAGGATALCPPVKARAHGGPPMSHVVIQDAVIKCARSLPGILLGNHHKCVFNDRDDIYILGKAF